MMKMYGNGECDYIIIIIIIKLIIIISEMNTWNTQKIQ